MIYKIIENPTDNSFKDLVEHYNIEYPSGFIKDGDIYASLFINQHIDDIVIARTYKVNAKTKESALQNESVCLSGGWFKC